VAVLAAAALACGATACSSDPEPAAPAPSSSFDSRSLPPAAGPTATAAASSSPASTSASTSCVQETLADLDLAGRVGQLLMIGTPVSSPAAVTAAVRRHRLGGVFLAGRSGSGVTTVRARTDALGAAARGPGLLVAVDQEGGAVQTLTGSGFGSIPSAVRQGREPDDALAARTRSWTRALARAGITMNLAPVADTVTADRADRNPPIGVFGREYGHTSDDVAAAVTVVTRAMAGAEVLPTLKHFPGLGRVRYNTDTSSRAVDLVATADDVYLKPFVAGMKAGAGAVMISSARYPRLDPDAPAAFSTAIVTGLLRGRLGWQGVVISDDLGRAKAFSSVPVAQRAVRFVAAGGDIALSVRTSDAGPWARALTAKARSSASFRTQVDAAATRVLTLKERAGLLTC
jgi:beta-N-acetylhexosaminidase